MSSHPLLQSPADLVDLVAALPAAGPLPVRTVLVPTERHAHALRRALVASGRASALAGTRFVGPATLAMEVLHAGGSDLRAGEEGLRPARILALLEEETLPFEYFDADLLRGTPGWPEAFASAIHDLEGAALAPDTLPSGTPQWRDLALLWRSVSASAGPSATAARSYLRAAELLAGGLRLPTGPVLATITGRETAALSRFLRALPGATLAVSVARPVRERHLARVEALFGKAAREALAAGAPPSEVRDGARAADPLPLRAAGAARRDGPPSQPRPGRHGGGLGARRRRGGAGGGRRLGRPRGAGA